MFEQETYSFEVPADPLQEGDLFYGYEVGRWQLTRRIYTIVGVALLFNLGFIGLLAQTNFLTAKGCDSPFVGRVCQVLDMTYVATVLFGTEREYIDAEYQKADLSQADVVWIDQTGVSAPFEYPEGYFQLANPEMFTPADQLASQSLPLMPPLTAGKSLIDTPPITPKANDGAVPKGLSDSPFDLSETDTASNKGPKKPGKKGAADSNTAAPSDSTVADTNTNANANTAGTTSDPVNGIVINKRPIADLGNTVNDLISKHELDLQTPFVGSAQGRLTDEGRFDPKTLKILIQSADPDMQKVVQDGILAIDAAGYLQHLKAISGKSVDMTLQQDDLNISATVQTEMESDQRALSVKSTLDLSLALAKKLKEGDTADQNDKDDLVLLNGAKIETDGKKVIITFTVPKEVALPMIQRKLAEQAAANKSTMNLLKKNEDNTAIR